jgi:hypothetical protein
VRHHVALGAGVPVVVPGAAHGGGLVDHHEVVEARLEQLDPHTDPAGAGADNHDLPARGGHLRHLALGIAKVRGHTRVDQTVRQ